MGVDQCLELKDNNSQIFHIACMVMSIVHGLSILICFTFVGLTSVFFPILNAI